MTRTRRFLAFSLAGAMIIMLAAGCAKDGPNGSGAALTSAAPEEPDITVAAIPAVDLAGLYIAQDRGLFARQGLRVTIVPVPSSQSVIAQQLAGQVDVSAGSYVAYLAAQAGGARFRILASASTLSPDTRALVVTGVARAMGQAGILGGEDTTEAGQRALVSSMTSPGS